MYSFLYKEGLQRVAKIVLSNPNYRDVVGERVGGFFDAIGFREAGGNLSPGEALSALDRILYDRRVIRFTLPPRAAVAFGKTRNNIREFAFLRALLSGYGLDPRVFNTGLIPPESTNINVKELGRVVGSVRNCFVSYSKELEVLPPALILQLVNYSLAYLSWQWNFTVGWQVMPRVIVLANDHSPAQVACSIAAKEQGLPRVYMQHAEVSEAFPPLDFDVSLLRNRQSQRIYEEAGPIGGRVHVVGRERGEFNPRGYQAAVEEPCEIGLYLTAQTDWQGVHLALERLSVNKRVGSVFIKPHPAMPVRKVCEVCPPGVHVCVEVPERPHVAVVANSSVVIELLHRGIPVFQFYGMDSIPDDYYGFSRRGIARKVELADLQSSFWRTFNPDEAWLSAYVKYNPSAARKSQEAESALIADLAVYFDPAREDRSVNASVAEAVAEPYSYASSGSAVPDAKGSFGGRPAFPAQQFLLTRCPRTAFGVINRRNQADRAKWDPPLSGNLFIKAFESMFNDRSPVVYDLFALAADAEVLSDFAAWVKRRDLEWTGRRPGPSELDELIEYALTEPTDPDTCKHFEVLTLLLLIRFGDKVRIKRLFLEARFIAFERMHVNHRIGILKWLREQLPGDFPVPSMLADMYKSLSAFHRLKLKIISATEGLFEREPWCHRDIEERFVATAPESLRRDFLDFVLPCYNRNRWRMRYMDVKWSARQRHEIYVKIKASLDEGAAFSLVRLGDGEGYMFEGKCGFFTPEDMLNREQHWWGGEISQAVRNEILPLIRSAVEHANILGIPGVYRFLRDNTDRNSGLLDTPQGRGLVEVIHGISEFENQGQLFSEEKCNLALFVDPEVVLGLAGGTPRVVIVASAAPDIIKDLFGGNKEILYVAVPTHSRTVSNKKYTSFDKSLPYVYRNVQREIRSTVQSGDLVLVAAGIIGKIFIEDARQAGGVALDVGSCLDQWVQAGIHSLH